MVIWDKFTYIWETTSTMRYHRLACSILMGALLIFPARAWAACSGLPCQVQIPTTTATAQILSSGYGLTSLRMEMRITNFNSSITNNHLINFGGFGIQHFATNGIQVDCGPDNVPTGCGNYGTVQTFTNDMLIRVTRDVPNSQLRIEVFDTPTGANLVTAGATAAPIATFGSGSAIQSAGINLGNSGASGSIVFLRVFNTTVPMGTPVQVAYNPASPAPIADFEFLNSPSDSSGLGQNFLPVFSYSNAPTYQPVCNPGNYAVGRLGTSFTLDGSGSSPLDGSSALTYAWSYAPGADGVNQGMVPLSPSSAVTTTTPSTTFGSANFQLQVTDSHGTQSTCLVHNGVIIYDINGVINLSAEGMDGNSQQLIGPMIAYGRNPWPQADSTQKLTLDEQIANLQNYYTPFWRTPMGCTVTVTAGSSVLTGAGCGAGMAGLEAPCGGSGTTPLNEAVLILIYPGTDSRTHYFPTTVTSCNSATSINVSHFQGNQSTYPTSPVAPWPNCSNSCTFQWQWGYSDLSSTYSPQYQWGNWVNAGAPANYYDNVKDFYIMYWRSGIDTYKYWADTLADEWWEHPVLDQGFNCNLATNSTCWAPIFWKNMAMVGVFLRALEEGPSSPKWNGIHIVETLADFNLNIQYPIGAANGGIDLRETGYAQNLVAMCAAVDPSPTQRTFCQNSLVNTLTNLWTPFRRSDFGGNTWGQFFFNNSNQAISTSISAVTGGPSNMSVCTINGSTAVVGVNTAWTTALHNGLTPPTGAIWFFTPIGSGTAATLPPGNGVTPVSIGDPDLYQFTVNSATSITLARPYGGPTGCGRGFVVGFPQGNSGFVGWGVQPTYLGHNAQALFASAQALATVNPAAAATFKAYGDGSVQVVINHAIMSDTNGDPGGLYDIIYSVGCVPPIAFNSDPCYPAGTNATGARTLMLELPRAFYLDYHFFHNPATFAAGNLIMSRMWSAPGSAGPNPDGQWITDFAQNSGFYVTGTPPFGMAPKWTGQSCGYTEGCSIWPTVRQFLVAGTEATGAKPAITGAQPVK